MRLSNIKHDIISQYQKFVELKDTSSLENYIDNMPVKKLPQIQVMINNDGGIERQMNMHPGRFKKRTSVSNVPQLSPLQF